MSKLTQEEIEILKSQNGGEIFEISIEEKTAYFKKPDRKTLSYATVSGGTKDPFKFNEIILESCFIAGDRALIDDDKYFMGMSGTVAELIEIKHATLKKLLKAAEVDESDTLRISNAQLQYYFHIADPDSLSDEDWARKVKELEWIRKSEKP